MRDRRRTAHDRRTVHDRRTPSSRFSRAPCAPRAGLLLRVLLPVLAAACAPPSSREQLAAVSGGSAPVILIVLDTLRADHTSLGGSARDTTPFLAELARRAVVFRQARTVASWTRPAMASLFSARLPASHGCEGRLGRLAPEVPLLPEILREAGYDTRAVQANGNLASVYGFERGFNDYRFVKGRPLLPYADAELLHGFVADSVQRLQPPPFFLYLHYVDPHDPYRWHAEHDWNPDYAGTFDGSERALEPFRTLRPSAPNVQRSADLYDGEIAWLDERLRELFALLAEAGVLEHAWVIVTSDHGEGLWEHVIQGHADEVFESQLRVPLLLLPPGGLDRPLHVSEPFPLTDLAPTLLELLGMPPCAAFEGRSWAGHLLTGSPAPQGPLIAQTETAGATLDAISDGRFKLIIDRRTGRRQCFDLGADPGEQRPLDPRGEAAAVALRLERELEAALDAAREQRPDAAQTQLDVLPEDVRLHLQAFGYAGGGG